jgi:hypothetical protein
MPITRNQAARQVYTPEEDEVADCVEMYMTFCTANIPPKVRVHNPPVLLLLPLSNIVLQILDEYIDKSYQGAFDLADQVVGVAPCILETTDLNSINHGSRQPMRAFKSPFLGKSDDEIRTWVNEQNDPNERPFFSRLTFTILDNDAIKNKTCRVGYTLGDDRMLLTDFYGNIFLRVPVEEGTISWDEEPRVGTEKIFDRKYIENGQHET